jgi:predicted metal-dependent hydrolase
MSALTVRKLNVDLSRGFGRHWLNGDVYRTAFMNALSMGFPLGEQIFIDSVAAVPRESILDPELRAEVRDFVGQEASHRFIHQQYNDELARQGYDYIIEPAMRQRRELLGRLPAADRLAVTCALEHLTATLADFILRHPDWMDGAEPKMFTLWSWHAAEEAEHKGVAFDLYCAVGGSWGKRVRWYLLIGAMFAVDTWRQTCHNLGCDGKLWCPGTWMSAARAWFGRKGMAWTMAPAVLRYLSPRFHPWQHDNHDLIRMWLERNGATYRAIRSTPS